MSAACTNESGLCTDSPAVNRTLYRYDALGQRVEKRTGDGNITRYLYDNGQLAAEYTTAAATESGRRYLTTDHLGTTRVITDPTGTILTRRDYFPFGEEISPATLATGNIRSTISAYGDNTISSTTVRFTGKERDAESGLDYFGARYMSAVGGRFTTRDPVMATASLFNSQSWNAYTYGLSNPLKYIDSNGESPTLISGGIGLFVGFVGGAAFSAGSQLIQNGFDFGQIDGRKVLNSAVGGGVAGGIAGLTLGIGTAAIATSELILANGSAAVIGGITTRTLDEQINCGICTGPASGADEATSIILDFTLGGLGAKYGGHIADRTIEIPNIRAEVARLKFSGRRSLRPSRIKAAEENYLRQRRGNEALGGLTGTAFGGYLNEVLPVFRGTVPPYRKTRFCVSTKDTLGNVDSGCA